MKWALLWGGEATLSALGAVCYERNRQDEKWGVQNHDPFLWLGILMEEVGEVARDLIEMDAFNRPEQFEKYRSELIQVAAVAVAAVECLDRGRA